MKIFVTCRDDDFVPVIGGIDFADGYVRDDLDSLRNVKADSDLDRHLIRMLALHKQLRTKFHNQDVTSLSNTVKQALLQDMNNLLGIRHLSVKSKAIR